MGPKKQKYRNDKMLQEFHDFVVKNKRAPKAKEITFENGFSYTYSTYRAHFDTIRNIINLSNSEKFIAPEIIVIAQNAKRSQYSGYDFNRITGQIRKLLTENPEAGYKELETMLGPLNRSIRVIYYRIYKEMFQKSGCLKKEQAS